MYIHCRTPVWLKTAFAVLVQEGGGVLVHGWCAEKENKGKGGSGQGKIGAKVVREWVPIGTQLGTNLAFFGQRFCRVLAPFWVI